jgi:hypothetical protein
MAVRRDNQYRRRRAASSQRRPGHLRTNYVEDDIVAFAADLERLRSEWSESVREADSKAELREAFKTNGIICLIVMVPMTAIMVYLVASDDAPWWSIPVVQSFLLLYLWFRLLMFHGEDTMFLIYREADRRGIKYTKDVTPLYHIMNRLNADYNSHLWNKTFRW